MDKRHITEIMNQVYELQGLLRLVENSSAGDPRICRLIAEKGRKIKALTEALETPQEAAASVATIQLPPVPEIVPEPVSEPAPVAASAAVGQVASQESDDEVIEEILEAPAPGIAEQKTEPLPKATRPIKYARENPRPALRKLFPINEFFRFRRELFAGSDLDFNSSLCILEEFSEISQAEDYFFNDLQWDSSDSCVEEFFEIIRKHFQNL